MKDVGEEERERLRQIMAVYNSFCKIIFFLQNKFFWLNNCEKTSTQILTYTFILIISGYSKVRT